MSLPLHLPLQDEQRFLAQGWQVYEMFLGAHSFDYPEIRRGKKKEY